MAVPLAMASVVRSMIAVRPALKMAFCPTFSALSVDCVRSAATAYLASDASYLCA